jgi:hypothetical protein
MQLPISLPAQDLLIDQEQSVDRIELHVGAAVEIAGRAVQRFDRAALGRDVIEFDAEIVLRGRARNAIGGIHGDTVDFAIAETGVLFRAAGRTPSFPRGRTDYFPTWTNGLWFLFRMPRF